MIRIVLITQAVKWSSEARVLKDWSSGNGATGWLWRREPVEEVGCCGVALAGYKETSLPLPLFFLVQAARR